MAWPPISPRGEPNTGELLYSTFYWLSGLLLGGVSLFGSARLVRVVEQLDAARTELAEAAVGQERLRLSRDLHDLLGQSLSAVSLKGDLALALLGRDPATSRAEIESLTALHARRCTGSARSPATSTRCSWAPSSKAPPHC